ncbi:MAG: hybrid sensor histidine kinase/response regulator, partial [Deferrisomatales bacterium]
TGWRQDDAAGKPLARVFHLLDETDRTPGDDPAAAVLRTGTAFEPADQGVLVAATGREHLVWNTAAPIRDAADRVIGAVLVFRDVTERRAVQEERLKLDKLDSVGVLAGGIAHDFNNLLTVILNNLALAVRRGPAGDGASQVLRRAESAALQARHLSQQLLTFAKGGAPVRAVLALPSVVEEAARFTLSGSKVQCSFTFPEGLWPVEADEGQVTQVVSNLVLNAQQATRGGAPIRVSCENVTLGRGELPPLREGRYLALTVQDRGMGIPREHLRKIFDPYFSTKGTGNGLGLTTAHSIVKNHGGHITVRSEVGSGSTFTVYLPACDAAGVAPTAPADPTVPTGGVVLIMDDEKEVREATGELLEFLGFRAVLAADGGEAVRLYSQALAAGSPFDTVLLDLTVPGGMGGKEAVARLRELDPQVRAVVSSGYSNDPVLADWARHGFAGVLAKPYRAEELSRVLRSVRRAPAGGENPAPARADREA